MVGRLSESPAMAGTGVAAAALPMLPSTGPLCVILNVPASCVSEALGVAISIAASAKILSPSSIDMSWMLTAGGISAVPDISVSGDSSDCTPSVFMSSESAVEFWCRIEGRLRERIVWPIEELGRTVGDLICGGGRGVVGETGWDTMEG